MTSRSCWHRSDKRTRATPPPRAATRRRYRFAGACLGVVSLGLLAAACGGGGSSPGVASLGPTTTTNPNASLLPRGSSGSATVKLQYAQCMQSHGVTNFPDPGPNAVSAMKHVDYYTKQFRTAFQTCQERLPKGGPVSPAEAEKVQAEALRFAKCMQAHGLPNWPDPLANGGYVAVAVGAAAKSPVYKTAAKVCDPLLPKG